MDNGQFRRVKSKKTALISGGKGSSIEPSSEPKERPLSSKYYSTGLRDRRRMVQNAGKKAKKGSVMDEQDGNPVNYGRLQYNSPQ